MLYYKINFNLIDKSVDRENAEEELYWYLGVLHKNGNALRDYKVVVKEKGYDVYIGMYDKYPIKNEKYRNKYIDENNLSNNIKETIDYEDDDETASPARNFGILCRLGYIGRTCGMRKSKPTRYGNPYLQA